MQNISVDRDCRVYTSKGYELDQKVRFPARVHSPVTGKTAVCKDRAALAALLQDHINAIPRCFYTVAEILEWLTYSDQPLRDAISKNDYQVRQMLDEMCIYMD